MTRGARCRDRNQNRDEGRNEDLRRTNVQMTAGPVPAKLLVALSFELNTRKRHKRRLMATNAEASKRGVLDDLTNSKGPMSGISEKARDPPRAAAPRPPLPFDRRGGGALVASARARVGRGARDATPATCQRRGHRAARARSTPAAAPHLTSFPSRSRPCLLWRQGSRAGVAPVAQPANMRVTRQRARAQQLQLQQQQLQQEHSTGSDPMAVEPVVNLDPHTAQVAMKAPRPIKCKSVTLFLRLGQQTDQAKIWRHQ